ncbi:MAG: response regulator [Deltaproteobacteria bacterium]|nr:response regulator [Deltaproteobacteria bacterium]
MNTLAAKTGDQAGQKETKTVNLSHGLTKGRLLVIDDDVGMRSLLNDVLCTSGYTVTSFSDAIGALKIVTANDQNIDAIICDLNMPRISGFDFLDMLQRMKSKIPLILITAFGTKKTEQEAQKKGAFGYLSKPFQLSEISELIQKAVNPL